jgi:hypothetical protein
MNGGSCGFGRVCSRPARVIKGAKKAACYPKTRHYPQSFARRFAPPLFLPVASSHHEVLTMAKQARPTPLAPRPRLAALLRASFIQSRV